VGARLARCNRPVELAKRKHAIVPRNAKRSTVKKIRRTPLIITMNHWPFERKCMAKSKLDAEVDAALERAKQDEDMVVAESIKYYPSLKVFIMNLSNGARQVLQKEHLQGLQNATSKQLADVEVWKPGTAIHWKQLNVDLYVPALLKGVYGTKQWMSQFARLGGSSKSKAKAAAARRNGAKGGRPRKHTAA
jgi:hypothetical protein